MARDWAWALRVTPPQKLVILALAERADDSGACWPSLTYLTDMTGLVRSTIAVALTGLEEARLIARDRGGAGRSTRYRLLMNAVGVASSGSGVGFETPRVERGATPGIDQDSRTDGPPASPGDGLARESVVRETHQGSPAGGLPGSPADGLVRETVVRETDRGSPTNGPGSPADGLAVVRETDPNRQLNRHRTESEPSVCGDDTAHPKKRKANNSRKATPIPSDWRPGDRVFDWAVKRGMTRTWVEAQIEEFLVYWGDTGERRKSWDATFINRLQALQANQAKDQAHEPEPRLADKDYLTGATPIDQIPWLDPAAFR